MSFFERAREFRGGGGSSSRRTGRVRASGHSLADDGGEWNVLYGTLFAGAWAFAENLQVFDEAMGTFAENDIDGWRGIAVLGGTSWDKRMVSTEPFSRWLEIQRGAVRRGWREFGRRCVFTIFGGQLNGADTPEKRWAIVRAIPAMVKGDEDAYLLIEIANEFRRANLDLAEVRAQAEWLQSQIRIPVAPSAPGHDEHGKDFSDLYSRIQTQGLTFHVDRKTGDGPTEPTWNWYETLWVPFQPTLRFNNEPPDQYASGFADHDPRRITARAVMTWMAEGCAYCWHLGTGKRLGDGWEPQIPAKLTDTDNFAPTVQGFRSMRRILPVMQNAPWWAGHMGDNPVKTVNRDDYDNGGLFKGFTVRMPTTGQLIDLRLGVKRDVEMHTTQTLMEVDLLTGDGIRVVNDTYRLDPSRPETLFVGIV